MADIFIQNYSFSSLPRSVIKMIGDDLLPKRYELSVVGIGSVRARNLNKQYRKKNYVPDVLSFPLSKNSGEIFMNVSSIYADAEIYGLPKKEYLTFLYIHSILHLLGYTHGSIMEKKENFLCKRYTIQKPFI